MRRTSMCGLNVRPSTSIASDVIQHPISNISANALIPNSEISSVPSSKTRKIATKLDKISFFLHFPQKTFAHIIYFSYLCTLFGITNDMSSYITKNIIVFGGNHHNTLGVIRSLGKKGIFPELLLHSTLPEDKCNNLKSRYLKKWIKVNTCDDGIDFLLKNKKPDEKSIIICSSDGAASAVDRHYKELVDYYIFPNCGQQGRLTELMDKETMSKIALESGLEVPTTITIEDKKIPDGTPYPCITKPLLSIEGSKDDIRICHNKKELSNVLLNSSCSRFQVQKFIDKDFEYQLIGIVVGGKVIIPGRSRIITQPVYTNTGYLHYEHLDGTEPIKECERFLQKANYSGLFSMEFLRGKDGHNYFMEINFRNDGNSISVTESGINLHYIWYAFNAGLDWDSELAKDIQELYVMPEFTELSLWYQGKIGLIRFIREMKQANTFMDYAKDDEAPTDGFRSFIKALIFSIIKKPAFLIKHNIILKQ